MSIIATSEIMTSSFTILSLLNFSWFARTDVSLSDAERRDAARNLIREFYALLLNAVRIAAVHPNAQ